MNKGKEKGVDPTGVGSNKARNKAGPDSEALPDGAHESGFIL